MSSFNKVILVGKVADHPLLTYNDVHTPRCVFALAVDMRVEGDRLAKPAVFDVVATGRCAETLAKYVEKGHPLLVHGRLAYDKARCAHVQLEGFQFLGKNFGLGKERAS